MNVYKFEWECRVALSPAQSSLLIQQLGTYNADIMFSNYENTKQVDAKSILGLVSLAIDEGDTWVIWINSKPELMPKLVELFESIGDVFNLEEVN